MNPDFSYIDEATKTQIQEQGNQDGQQKQHFSSVEATEFQVQQQQTAIKQLESNQYYNQIINPIKIQKNQQQWQSEITKQLQVKCLSLELLEKTFNKTEQEILNVVKGKVFVFNGYMFLRSKYLLEDEIEQAIRDSLLMIAAGCMNEELKIGKFDGGQINRIKYQESTKVSPYTFYRMCQEQDLFTINPLDDNMMILGMIKYFYKVIELMNAQILLENQKLQNKDVKKLKNLKNSIYNQLNDILIFLQIQQKVNNIQQGYTKVRAYLLTTPETDLPVKNPLTHKVGNVEIDQRKVKEIKPLENIQEEPKPIKLNQPFKNVQTIYADYIEQYELKQQNQIDKLQQQNLKKQQKLEEEQRRKQQKEEEKLAKSRAYEEAKLQKTQKLEQEKADKLRIKQEKEAEKERKQLEKQQEKERKMMLSTQKTNSTLFVSNLTKKNQEDDEGSTDSVEDNHGKQQKKKMLVEISDFSSYIRYKVHQKQTEGCQRCCRIFEWMLLVLITIITSVTLYLVSQSMFGERPIIPITGDKQQVSSQSIQQLQNQISLESKAIVNRIEQLKQQMQNIKVQCNYKEQQPQQSQQQNQQNQQQPQVISYQTPEECKDIVQQIKVLQDKIDQLSKKQINPYTDLIKQHTILKPRANITSITTSQKGSKWWPQLFNQQNQLIPGQCFRMQHKTDLHIVTSPFQLNSLIVAHPSEEELQDYGRVHAPASIQFTIKYISGVNQYQEIQFTKQFDLNGERFQKIDFQELEGKEITQIDIQMDNENGTKTLCLYEFTLLGDYTQLNKTIQNQSK